MADLLAIAREGLANVARHSSASHGIVELSEADGNVRLAIADDGIGFAPDTQLGGGHHGLPNMRARAEAMGGSLAIDSSPGGGTRIIVTVPTSGRAGEAG